MIQINKQYSVYRDAYNWVLVQTIPYTDNAGQPATKQKKTYHPNFEAIAKHIIDKRLGNTESLQDILKLLTVTIKMFNAQLTRMAKHESIPEK